MIKAIGKAAAIKPLGRGSNAKTTGLRPVVKHAFPRAGAGVVGFIDDDQVGLPFAQIETTDERLHACHLDVGERGADAGGDDAVIDAGSSELGGCLAHQLTAMH